MRRQWRGRSLRARRSRASAYILVHLIDKSRSVRKLAVVRLNGYTAGLRAGPRQAVLHSRCAVLGTSSNRAPGMGRTEVPARDHG